MGEVSLSVLLIYLEKVFKQVICKVQSNDFRRENATLAFSHT